jgi:carboxyl-terminal processing protease
MVAKVTRISVTALLAVVVASGLVYGGFVAGMRYHAGQRSLSGEGLALPGFLPQAAEPDQGGTPDELAETFEPFWEAWDLVHDEYVDQPVDDEQLMQGAIRGMVEALDDQHSAYLSEQENQMLTSDLSGQLEGIGAEVDTSGEYVKIISPLPGSPAEQAGILPGDTILEVDGEDLLGLSGTEVILKVRGPAGSQVRLTIGREGHPEPLEFDIVRAKIVIPSVEGELLDDGIAYVKINTFGDRTAGDLRQTLADLNRQNPNGVVLDLRGNPGGYLEAAIDVVSQFIGDGTVMIERFGDGREETYTARRGGLDTDLPIVVLINEAAPALLRSSPGPSRTPAGGRWWARPPTARAPCRSPINCTTTAA